jgi:choline dehydrogenase
VRTGFDTIIVGAGSAGCVLAAQLSQDPSRQVLLLEAGPAHALDHRPEALQLLSRPITWPFDWDDHVANIDGRLLTYGRGRGLGGSSATNGAVALRPEPEDLARWPKGWQWDEMLPVFCQLERDLDFGDRPWHGDRGPVPITRWLRSEWNEMQAGFVAGGEALGIAYCADHSEPGSSGVGPVPMNRIGQRRVSAHMAFLAPAHERGNLTVRGDTHVRRVLIEQGRAVGVELTDATVLLADEVILSAGVVQDPLLLWRSGIGPAERLRSLGVPLIVDLPVGRHLTDHVVVNYMAAIHPGAIPDDAPSLQTMLRATAPGSAQRHDLQLTPWARRHGDGRRELGISVSLQLPDGEGMIEPSGDDLMGPAFISWPFTGIHSNVTRLRDGWRMAAHIARHSGVARRPGDIDADLVQTDAEVDRLVRDTHGAFYHGVGTCRMGTTGVDHVVDTECAVLGVEALSVVDAAIIPTVPRTNTNLAAMAVAARFVERRRARGR